MKYIDADKLIAKIVELRKELPNTIEHLNDEESGFARGQQYELTAIEAEILCLQQEQPDTKESISHLEHWLAFFGCPEENIEKCATQIAQGYGAIRYLEGIRHGAEAVNELAQQEQPEVDLEKDIDEKWDEFVSSEGEREDFTNIARRFAEWGATHLRK